MLNTKNMAFANICFMSSNSGTMPPKTAANINRAWAY